MMFLKKVFEPFKHPKITRPERKKKNKAQPKNSKQTIRRLGRYLLQSKRALTVVILLVILSSVLSLLGPLIVGKSIDRFIVQMQFTGLGTTLLLLSGIFLLSMLAVFIQNILMIQVAQKTVHTLREDLFTKFHTLPIRFFDERQQGELMSRVTNDIDQINNTLSQSVIQISSGVITLIGTVGVMLYLSPLLTVITLTIIPLLFIGMRWITNRTGPLYKKQQEHLGAMNGFVEEMLSGQEIIKIYSQEDKVIKQFKEQNDALFSSNFWTQTFSGMIPKIMFFLNLISFTLIAIFGGIFAIKGFITVGVIVIFTEYTRQFTRPLNDLSNQFNTLLAAIAGAERVFGILDEPIEVEDTKAKNISTILDGEIEFNHVDFSYDGQTNVLHDVSFKINPGDTVAFVGHTGAGKSTIMNILTRFYPYAGGNISLDGIELTQWHRENLRKQIAFVMQDNFLFRGTIRDNIRYGTFLASDEEIIEAAKAANAHPFIMNLPNDYDTVVGDETTTLSSGEKQLLTIARAMIQKPAILLLDEATSQIDTITEIKIQEALKRLMKNRTSLVIAHRLNTIRTADHIIMLEHGRIVEYGTHQQLLEKHGAYYDLANG